MVLIGGLGPKESKVRSRKIKRFGWQNIEEVGGGTESCSPKGGRYVSLEKEGANDIVSSVNNAFSFTILGRSVGARHSEMNAMGQEESAGAEVIELAAVVSLH